MDKISSCFRSAFAALVLGGGIGAAALIDQAGAQAQVPSTPADAKSVADGKYLATAGDCAACHTAPGGQPFAGGLAINTPFGKILAPNITPDKETGIGNMSDADFIKAMRQGIGQSGHLYPAMPYVYFNSLPDDQVLEIRAYLNTLAPVHHKVVADQLPFPFNIRLLMVGWNMLFFPEKGAYMPDPNQSLRWNRGAYLVQGLEHCAACHTPKNAFGGDKTGQKFQGYIVDGWNAPNITDAWNGIGAWSVQDIADYLKTGHNQYAYASGPMADAVKNSTSKLTDADINAMAVYIKSQPGRGGNPPAPLAATDPAMVAGADIYKDECSACHTDGGIGKPGIFPNLVKSPAVQADQPATLMGIVLHGGQGVGTEVSPTAPAMPAFGGLMNDQQIADVLTYIRNSWGNRAPRVSAADVEKIRQQAPQS
jgi:mono/diheme cytochrome c family protein